MAERVLVDAGFLIALLNRRDEHHRWAATQAAEREPPWTTCEAALSEAFHVLGSPGRGSLDSLLRRKAVVNAFDLSTELERVLDLMAKYADVPMALADACLVRMSELHSSPMLLTTDDGFRRYRRHSRQVIPCLLP